MISSLASMLATPVAAVIGLICFLVSGGLLIFRGKALPKGAKAALIVVLALSILYLLFGLWLVIGFGSSRDPNYAPIPAPN